MMLRSRPSRATFATPIGTRVIFGWQIFLDAAIERLVLEENHRVVIAYGGFDQALGVVGRGRRHHLQSGRPHKPHLGVLRMERATVNAATRRRAHYYRHRSAPAVTTLGGEIHDLVEAAGDEI